MRRLILLMLALSILSACAAIDNQGVGGRVGQMNKGIADYRNEATLLNIIRASKTYPLNFVAVSGVTGHNSLNLGIPVIAIPPIGGSTVTLGQGTDQYNASNDFAVNVVDDPATYVALHTPIDPATMAFFYEEGVGATLLDLLFIHHIHVTGPGVDTTIFSAQVGHKPKVEDDTGEQTFRTDLFFATLAYYGLTFQVQAGSAPGLQKKPRSQICFDSTYSSLLLRRVPVRSLTSILLDRDDRIVVPPRSTCTDHAHWLPAPAGDAPTTTATAAICEAGPCIAKAKSADKTPSASYAVDVPFEHLHFEIYTRSVYGMYQFLGQLLDAHVSPVLLRTPKDSDNLFFDIENGGGQACAVTASLDSETYCVPRGRQNTLYIFNVLHELTALETSAQPTQPANTSTVRITP